MPRDTIGSSVPKPAATFPRSPHRKVSPPLFGTILLCFLLPFMTIQCGLDVTFTGLQAATGIDRPDALADYSTPSFWALAAFASAAVGLLVALLRGRRGALGGAIAGLAGIIGLVGFLAFVTGETQGNFDPRIGYSLSLFLFLCAVALNDYLLTRPRTPGKTGEPVTRTSKRVYVITVSLAGLLLLLGSEGGREGTGYHGFGGYAGVFFTGVLLAVCTALGAVIHAFRFRYRSDYR